MTKLNPNHPVTQQLDGQYHKLMAIVLDKFSLGEVVITAADFEAIKDRFDGMPCVMVHDKADGIHIKLTTEAEGMRLAREHGGLPQ